MSTYLPSYKRADEPPPMRLTQRDKAIILAVYHYRLLSSEQIEALFFPSEQPRGCQTSCQRRLQLLFHHQYLARVFQPIILGEGRTPYVYALDEKGADLAAATLGVDRAGIGWQPKVNQVGISFIAHTLAVNDVRVVMTLLTRQTPLKLVEWVSEADFRTAEYAQRVPIRMRGGRTIRNYPDGYMRLALPGAAQDAHSFLEVDQGTMSNNRWQDKVRAYDEFRRRGLSQHHYGTSHFRILTITTSPKRLQNLKQATEKAGGDHYFWFTTQDRVNLWQPQTLLDPIWWIATKDEPQALFPKLV